MCGSALAHDEQWQAVSKLGCHKSEKFREQARSHKKTCMNAIGRVGHVGCVGVRLRTMSSGKP